MARVYNTRQLLDPNMISILNQQAANKLQFETEQNKAKYDAIRKALGTAGSVGQNMYDQSRRASEMEDEWSISPEVLNDPVYKAAREEYIRTGSSGPLQQFIMQKEAAKARDLEAKKRQDAIDFEKKRSEEIRKENARVAYAKAQKAMNDAIDAGDYEQANIAKKEMDSIEYPFGVGTFGASSDEQIEARKKTREEKVAAELDEKTKQLADEQRKKDSFTKRLAIEANVIPNATSFEDKVNYKKMVKSLHDNGHLSDEDAAILFKEIDSFETLGEAKQKAVQAAKATKAGEKTGKSIDEATNKAEAAKYIGQKMNSLNYEDIPEDIRKYLKMDSKGIVGWK